MRSARRWACIGAVLAGLGLLPAVARAQGFAQQPLPPSGATFNAPPPGTGSVSGPGESNVSFIDNALPQTLFRLRFDDSFRMNRPDRAEYLFAPTGPGRPGLPLLERRIDYQEATSYVEVSPAGPFSVFAQAPFRFVDPEVNANHWGYGDASIGVKWAMLSTPDLTATLQLRGYVPTGAASRGLGTDHYSVEPAFLLNARLADLLVLEGEARYWRAIDGGGNQGDLVRYGLGLSLARNPESWWVTPVAEVVGWSVLGGKETVVNPTGATIISAKGDTILNGDIGVRVGISYAADLYIGYSRALTGAYWSKDLYRIELRLIY